MLFINRVTRKALVVSGVKLKLLQTRISIVRGHSIYKSIKDVFQ